MSANPEHPFHVACGNNKMLRDDPKEKGTWRAIGLLKKNQSRDVWLPAIEASDASVDRFRSL